MVKEFVLNHLHARAYPSLVQLRYLSCMKLVDGVVGNSSSGIIEAPSLFKGTINIGARQDGRKKADSIIDCQPLREDIGRALRRLYSEEFQTLLPTVHNPYGEPGASDKIVELLRTVSRSEERRVGKAGCSTLSSRWSPNH